MPLPPSLGSLKRFWAKSSVTQGLDVNFDLEPLFEDVGGAHRPSASEIQAKTDRFDEAMSAELDDNTCGTLLVFTNALDKVFALYFPHTKRSSCFSRRAHFSQEGDCGSTIGQGSPYPPEQILAFVENSLATTVEDSFSTFKSKPIIEMLGAQCHAASGPTLFVMPRSQSSPKHRFAIWLWYRQPVVAEDGKTNYVCQSGIIVQTLQEKFENGSSMKIWDLPSTGTTPTPFHYNAFRCYLVLKGKRRETRGSELELLEAASFSMSGGINITRSLCSLTSRPPFSPLARKPMNVLQEFCVTFLTRPQLEQWLKRFLPLYYAAWHRAAVVFWLKEHSPKEKLKALALRVSNLKEESAPLDDEDLSFVKECTKCCAMLIEEAHQYCLPFDVGGAEEGEWEYSNGEECRWPDVLCDLLNGVHPHSLNVSAAFAEALEEYWRAREVMEVCRNVYENSACQQEACQNERYTAAPSYQEELEKCCEMERRCELAVARFFESSIELLKFRPGRSLHQTNRSVRWMIERIRGVLLLKNLNNVAGCESVVTFDDDAIHPHSDLVKHIELSDWFVAQQLSTLTRSEN